MKTKKENQSEFLQVVESTHTPTSGAIVSCVSSMGCESWFPLTISKLHKSIDSSFQNVREVKYVPPLKEKMNFPSLPSQTICGQNSNLYSIHYQLQSSIAKLIHKHTLFPNVFSSCIYSLQYTQSATIIFCPLKDSNQVLIPNFSSDDVQLTENELLRQVWHNNSAD